MRKKIEADVKLSESEQFLLDNHSLLNLLNVLYLELDKLLQKVNNNPLSDLQEKLIEMLAQIGDPIVTNKLSSFEEFMLSCRPFLTEISITHPEYQQKVRSITTILEVAVVRIEEFNRDRFTWTTIPVQMIRNKLIQFFSATETVSNHRYHFVYPPDNPDENEYKINLEFGNIESAEIFAPPVIHDLLRDLAANSRKYSRPGTMISILVEQLRDRGVKIVIKDEGMGIMEDEIDQIVQFGYRASNVKNIRTMGNGFGLTKAFHVTHIFNGQMIIDSTPGDGTTIELTMYPDK